MFDDTGYRMLPEKVRHEMKQLASIANTLIKNERRQRVEVLIKKFAQRCFDLIDEAYRCKLEDCNE